MSYMEQVEPASKWLRDTPLQIFTDISKSDHLYPLYNVLLYSTKGIIDYTSVLRIILRSYQIEKFMGV